MTNNEIIIPENEIYELLKTKDSQDPNKIDKIIRHFKVIKRNNYNNVVTVILYKKYNGQIIEIEYDPNNSDNQIINDKDIIGYRYNANDYLSQDYDEYENKVIIKPFKLYNSYKDLEQMVGECDEIINNEEHNLNKPMTFGKKHYSSIDEIKHKIDESTQNVNRQYVNEIISNSTINIEDAAENTNINNVITSFKNNTNNKLYIRMAPPKEMKEELIKRILAFNNVGMDLDLAMSDGIPVFNDNIIYKNAKYANVINALFDNELIDEQTKEELLNA